MLWAVSAMAFLTLSVGRVDSGVGTIFRPEGTSTLEDLAVDNRAAPTIVAFQLKKTKMDPFMKGVRVTVGRTGQEICPVEAMMAYLRLRGS